LERDAHNHLYAAADDVAERLGLGVPITFYQTQNAVNLNVGIVFIPGQAHITIDGPVLQMLDDAELAAVIGHELGHLTLRENWDNDYLVAEQILSAMTTDAEASVAHLNSGRLYALFTETFCDRTALAATENQAATISMLVKIQTGLTEVSAESYRRQAAEIFEKDTPKTDGLTHPESFIRTRAIDLWCSGADDAEEQIERIIRGPLSLDNVDLLSQQTVSKMTQRLIDAFLTQDWCRTDVLMAHARSYFSDYTHPTNGKADATVADAVLTDMVFADPVLAEQIAGCDESLRDYCCYVLMDFVLADRDLEEAPIAAALLLTQRLGFADRFGEILVKEAKLRKKQFDTIRRDAESIVARASAAASES
jgi:hypothetical protein